MSNINEFENGNNMNEGRDVFVNNGNESGVGNIPEDIKTDNDNTVRENIKSSADNTGFAGISEKILEVHDDVMNAENVSSDKEQLSANENVQVSSTEPQMAAASDENAGNTSVYAHMPENPNQGSGMGNFGSQQQFHSQYAQNPNAENIHRAESAGIRYNADKNSSDGNYTWQYYKTEEPHIGQHEPVKKKKHTALKVVGITLASVVVLGAVGVLSYFAVNNIKNRPADFESYYYKYDSDAGIDSNNGDKEDRDDYPIIGKGKEDKKDTGAQNVVITPDESGVLTKQMIAVKCKPSSVGIEVTATTQSYFGSYKSSGVGSGFILTDDGYIATNNHVIEGADEITVMLDDGTKYPAKVIGADSVTDLAVVKIEATGLVPMEIGDSDIMQVGDSVIAIGTPAGIEFAGTVTDGIVSAINREVEVQGSNGYTKKMTLMQTNAAINPGNSGGPLINNKGQVIGINTLKLTEKYEGIGFSIPINSAVNIFNQLIKDGRVTNYDRSFVTGNGAIGITNYVEVTEEESKYYGIPVGIMVVQLKLGSSAQQAGLKRGDIITGFNGQKVATVAEINELKADFKAGDEVTLTVYRDPKEIIDITFKLDVMG